jgi:hypothetical protein
MANDGAALVIPKGTVPSVDALADMVEEYSQESRNRSNTIVRVDGGWDMVATRDIRKGEELFLPYGHMCVARHRRFSVLRVSATRRRRPTPLRVACLVCETGMRCVLS